MKFDLILIIKEKKQLALTELRRQLKSFKNSGLKNKITKNSNTKKYSCKKDYDEMLNKVKKIEKKVKELKEKLEKIDAPSLLKNTTLSNC